MFLSWLVSVPVRCQAGLFSIIVDCKISHIRSNKCSLLLCFRHYVPSSSTLYGKVSWVYPSSLRYRQFLFLFGITFSRITFIAGWRNLHSFSCFWAFSSNCTNIALHTKNNEKSEASTWALKIYLSSKIYRSLEIYLSLKIYLSFENLPEFWKSTWVLKIYLNFKINLSLKIYLSKPLKLLKLASPSWCSHLPSPASPLSHSTFCQHISLGSFSFFGGNNNHMWKMVTFVKH